MTVSAAPDWNTNHLSKRSVCTTASQGPNKHFALDNRQRSARCVPVSVWLHAPSQCQMHAALLKVMRAACVQPALHHTLKKTLFEPHA